MKVNQKGGGALLSYVMMITNVLVKFIYTPFFLRLMGQAEYGLYALAISIIGYLHILDFGFGSAVTRYTIKFSEEGDTDKLLRLYSTLSVIYIIIGTISLLACFFLNCFAVDIFGKSMTPDEIWKLRLMLLLCGFNLLFSFPLQISASILTAFERFVFKNGVKLIITVLQPFVIILLMYGIGIKSVGVIVVVTVFNLLTYILYYGYCRKNLDFKVVFSKFDKSMVRFLVSFSFAMFLLIVFEQFQFNSGQFVLGIFQGSKIVAVWGISMVFVLNYRSLSTAITNVFTPTVLKNVYNKDDVALSSSINKITHWQIIVLFPVLFNYLLFGKQFLSIWAGDAYIDAYETSSIIMIPMTFALLLEFSYMVQIAKNDLKYRIITLFGSFLGTFIIVYTLCGITLFSFSYICAISILVGQLLFVLVYIIRTMHINIVGVILNIAKSIVIPIAFTVIAFFILSALYNEILGEDYISFAISVLIYNAILLSLMWKFTLTPSDRSVIIKIKS